MEQDTKNKRCREAVRRTRDLDATHEDEIKTLVSKSRIYHGYCTPKKREHKIPQIQIYTSTTQAAVGISHKGKCAALNFASYTYPGGGYITGDMAQEEALCWDSLLYNVLKKFSEYYRWNKYNRNNYLYKNRAIYTPNVPFNSFEQCDIITCAAPNKKKAMSGLSKITEKDNYAALASRIRFILDIAEDQGVDTLILGAFGCGVFGQNPHEVAEVFKKLILSGMYGFEKIIFAIPCDTTENLNAFRSVINNQEEK